MKDDPEFNIYFVRLIEEHQCLYNYTCADYRNFSLQEQAWDEIAFRISEEAHDCKERWKNLRGCYTRHLKHTASSSTQTKIKKPYYLAEYLNFLKPYTKTRRSKSHFSIDSRNLDMISFPELIEEKIRNDSDSDNEENHLENDAPQSPSQSSYNDNRFLPPPSKRLKENTDANTSVTNESIYQDPDLAFLLSVLPDMKDMTNNQKRKFKIGIISLAGQILNDSQTNLSPKSNQTSSSTLPNSTIPKTEPEHNQDTS